MAWFSSGSIHSSYWYGTYSVSTPFRLTIRPNISSSTVKALTYQTTQPYTFKTDKNYQFVTTLCGYMNQTSPTAASFSINMCDWNEFLEYNQVTGATPSILQTVSGATYPGVTESRMYFYSSPPSNFSTTNLIRYFANSKFANTVTGGGGLNTGGIVSLKITELNYHIQGFAYYKYGGSPYTPWVSTSPNMFRNSLGWNYESDANGQELFHWYDHSSIGHYPVGPCSLNSGGRTQKRTSFGYKQNNFVARFIPYDYFNLSFNYQNEGDFPLEIYMSPSLPTGNPGSFSRPANSQLIAQFGNTTVNGFSSTQYFVQHSFYSVQGNRYLIIKGPAIGTQSSGFTYSNIFISNIKVEGGYHPGNNEQYLTTNTNQYYGTTTLEAIGLTGATFTAFVGSGNTVNATYSLSISEINTNIGNGLFKAGVWENGVWNSGWRYDDGVYEFNTVYQFFNFLKNKRWRMQIQGTELAASKFQIGDKVSIGNIVAIDINEERKVLRNYYTIINKTSDSIIVEFDNEFPLRRIEKDSAYHRIYVTKNVWLSGAFFNGYFRGIWNYGLFKGYPLITEMHDSHWIDGIFDGGHFATSYYEVPKFTDTIFYAETFGGKVGLTFSGKHNLFVGDIITIDKDNKNLNPDYDGETTVQNVINDYHIVTSKDWGSDSILEGGTVSVSISKGLMQKMKFKSNNKSRTTSNQSLDSASVFQYTSWIDVNYYDTSAVSIGKDTTLLDDISGLEFSENNLFGHPTNDVLQSQSSFRDSHTLLTKTYNLGTKYKIFNDYIGESGEFKQKFGPTGRGEQIFKNLGWTYSQYQTWCFTFSRTEDLGDGVILGEELKIEAFGKGGVLDIYPLTNDNIIGRTNQEINPKRYTTIEFDLVTYSTPSSFYEGIFIDSSIPSLTPAQKAGLFPKGTSKGAIATPQIHFNNLNRVRRNVYYGASIGTVSTIYDAEYLPNYTNINHLVTKNKRKVEYFFNKRHLSMHFSGDTSYYTVNTATYIIDNLKFYETDMIPFFKYFEESNINKGVQIPYQGVSPFIDYNDSSFNFIDNISIGVDSILIQAATSPPGGIAPGVIGNLTGYLPPPIYQSGPSTPSGSLSAGGTSPLLPPP